MLKALDYLTEKVIELEKSTRHIKELECKNENLRHRNCDLVAQFSRSGKKIDDLENRLKQLGRRFEDETNALKKSLKDRDAELNSLKSELELANDKIYLSQDDKDQIQSLKDSLDKRDAELNSLKEQLSLTKTDGFFKIKIDGYATFRESFGSFKTGDVVPFINVENADCINCIMQDNEVGIRTVNVHENIFSEIRFAASNWDGVVKCVKPWFLLGLKKGDYCNYLDSNEPDMILVEVSKNRVASLPRKDFEVLAF